MMRLSARQPAALPALWRGAAHQQPPARAALRQPLVPQAQQQLSTASANGVAAATSSSADGWLVCHPSPAARFDAIMVLGGGLLPGGGLPEWVVRRLEGGLHLYHQQAQQQQLASLQLRDAQQRVPQPQAHSPPPLVLLGAGTPHKRPELDSAGYVLHEATAYASYLMERGVPAQALLKEVQSYDTVGNGYFSLLIHAVPAGWRRLAVVTSHFHMPRTQAIFDTTYRLAGQSLYGSPDWYQLSYFPVSDAGIFTQEVLDARAVKEADAVAAWHANTSRMASLSDLHAWLYATHLCYSASRQHEFGRKDDLDPRLAATY